MCAVRDGASLPGFAWEVWWTNSVLMGVEMGDVFGDKFVTAVGLAPGSSWRLCVMAALVGKGLPVAWLPTALEASRGEEEAVSQLVAPLKKSDVLAVGKSVLAIDEVGNFQKGQVTRKGSTVDVSFGGSESEGMPSTKALVVAFDGAGALLRMAAGAGHTKLVLALLAQGVSCLVADARADDHADERHRSALRSRHC